MRVKISLKLPPSAVQLGHCRPHPPPIQNFPQRFEGCRGLLPSHIGGDALALLLGLGVPTLNPLALRPNGRAQNPPTPAHFQVSEHLQRLKPFGVKPFGVVVLVFWLGRSLPRPLSLHSAPQRTNPRIAELRSAVAKSGCIVARLFYCLMGLFVCAPLRVSLDCIFVYVIDHSALGAGCRPLLGRGCCSCR